MDKIQNALTFEEAMAVLEDALKNLSQGNIPLDEAVENYKKGLDMATFCQKKLQEAESEIKILQNGLESTFEIEESSL